MLGYILRRLLVAIGTVWSVSVISFVIIQLPPGDYVTSYIAQMAATGSIVSEQEAENLRRQYGLDQPMYVQYYKWMAQVVRGNFGMSMEWRRPVAEVIGDRLVLTMVVSFAALLLTWVLALPIGIYSAVRQYSLGDYLFTFVGFIGLAVPSFLLALVILYLGFVLFEANIGGLFASEYQDAPWTLAKVWDLLKHLPIPALILGLAGTAQQIRIMRANLLDELRKPYVVTARSKGLPEARVILKYPVRVALNPFASTIGYTLPYIVSGSIIVSLVLGLPTVGPLLLKALIAQDMFLAGTIVLLLGVMTVIISLLGWTELARVVRGRFLAMREEDFVVSARLVGCSRLRTIFVHMVPSFMSHIIAATTLALPAMIISETALSFLGLGLRPPAISWGVLLQQAQNVQTVAISPWLMLPSLPIIVAVLAFNFLGDGLRDAADPYGH